MSSEEITLKPSDASGEPLVRVTLVPVEVFGADECDRCESRAGYGLMDAVSAWSDCNRAIGKIYRREDLEGRDEKGTAGCISVYVPQSETGKFDRRYGDETDRDRCPACHVPYSKLPKEHRLRRPQCDGTVPYSGDDEQAKAGLFRYVLREHYLAEVICDHERKMDNPVCACSRVNLGWHPSVGAAVEAWIEHVLRSI